jgi:putative glycosyltransferase (TIGR04348 family)
LVLALTGTDLYGQSNADAAMQQSINLADRLIVLNRCALASLPEAARSKTTLCLPSCSERQARRKTSRHLRVLMAGHLREEKSPRTFFEAVRLLGQRADILFDHIGAALDPALGAEAMALAKEFPRYRWLGGLPHEQARARIQAAHVLVHPSRLEGGATVIVEAIRSGTPVIASRIAGNIGLLGEPYSGYVACDDAPGLASAISHARDEPAYLAQLQSQCALMATQFDPAQERNALLGLVASILGEPGESTAGSGA